jgi:hypothetical protein
MTGDLEATALARKTTGSGWTRAAVLAFLVAGTAACGGTVPDAGHAGAEEHESLSRTEFTDRIENFFEHDPLRAGEPSQFLIHLTDLADGTPVKQADVTLLARTKAGAEVAQVKAKVGKVTGIYVAEVVLPEPGTYDIEFRVTNGSIDERMSLRDFEVAAE